MRKINFYLILIFSFLFIFSAAKIDIQAAWIAPESDIDKGNTNIPAPLNEGGEYQEKQGNFILLDNFLVGSSLYVREATSQTSIGTMDIVNDMSLTVSGNIGAEEYCNKDGSVCKSVSEGGSKNYALDAKGEGDEDVLYVDEDGNVGFHNTSPKDGTLHIAGQGEMILEDSSAEILWLSDSDDKPGEGYEMITYQDTLSLLHSDKGIWGDLDDDASFYFYAGENNGELINNNESFLAIHEDVLVIKSDKPTVRFIDTEVNEDPGAGIRQSIWDLTTSDTNGNFVFNNSWPSPSVRAIEVGFNASGDANVGVFKEPDSNYQLDVGGIILIEGTFVCPSDITLKKDIKPIKNALSRINQIRGVYFDWKDPKKGVERQVGVIAQEVEKVLPEAVSSGDNGYKSVNYGVLNALLIEGVKELKQNLDNDVFEINNNQQKARKAICELSPEAEICD